MTRTIRVFLGGRTKVGAEAVRVLEMVRDDLPVFAEPVARLLLEPHRESLVQVARHGRTVDASFHSAALDGRLALIIHLPPGYSRGHARYPVIYFLHGLPASRLRTARSESSRAHSTAS